MVIMMDAEIYVKKDPWWVVGKLASYSNPNQADAQAFGESPSHEVLAFLPNLNCPISYHGEKPSYWVKHLAIVKNTLYAVED